MDSPPSNFTGDKVQCNAFLSTDTKKQVLLCRITMNAKSGPQKATDWVWYQKKKLLRETRLSWYQSIDQKHL
jgi:hypothetical protein